MAPRPARHPCLAFAARSPLTRSDTSPECWRRDST